MLDSSARRPCSCSSRASRRGPRAVRVAGVLTVALGLLVTGCAQEKQAAPPASPTPIANLNTGAMQVPRIKFCTLVPKAAVADALGGKPDSDTSYGNGNEQDVVGVGQDVVHEIGCAWNTDAGVSARAWVFARPVDAAFAHTVIASGRRTTGCRTVQGPKYGDPSATQVCQLPGGEQRVRHSGLFGDTWLTCELSATQVPGTEVRKRADSWCVEIANALNTAR